MATLKTGDLSVGDWVQDKNGIYAKVLGIENWSNGYFLNIKLHGVNVGVTPLASAHPIPITAEILEANGIHKTYEDDNYAIFRCDGLWAVKYSDGDWELSTPPGCLVDIKYVHKLQHALRLAGLDKEINL